MNQNANNLPHANQYIVMFYANYTPGFNWSTRQKSICNVCWYDKVTYMRYYDTDVETGEQIIRTLGYNLGMTSNYVNGGPRYCPIDNSNCYGIGGVRDSYDSSTWTKWTCCSNEDMKDYLELYDPICLIENTNITTTTSTTPKPKCKDFWYKKICAFFKYISKKDFNNKFCLTNDDEVTAYIRAHCYKLCCNCKKNKCPDITAQTLMAKKMTWENTLDIIMGICEVAADNRIDYDFSMMNNMTEIEVGDFLEDFLLDNGYKLEDYYLD